MVTASHYLRVVGVEFLLKLVAGARGDFVNTCTSHCWLINHFAPVLYLGKSDTDLLALNTVLQLCTREQLVDWYFFFFSRYANSYYV